MSEVLHNRFGGWGGITYTTLWKALEQLGVLSDTDTDKERGS